MIIFEDITERMMGIEMQETGNGKLKLNSIIMKITIYKWRLNQLERK
jgi:hypothetical protein